jgi:hypothetical protein
VAIDVTGVTGFEDQDDTTLLGPGTWLGANPNSTVSVEVNTTDPISGAQDVLMTFEYADETEAYQQWSSYLVPLAARPSDLSSLSGIRLWMQSDQARELMLSLDTSHASAENDYTRYVWFVSLTDQPTLVEVLFADLELPSWATDPGYTAADAQSAATGLVFAPRVVGVDSGGFLPDGTTDAGFLRIDDIEFF